MNSPSRQILGWYLNLAIFSRSSVILSSDAIVDTESDIKYPTKERLKYSHIIILSFFTGFNTLRTQAL
jgi:hypothetical protein